MSKRKHQAQGPLLYWWNEFLFARYFEYETDLTPEEVVDNIRDLALPHKGWLWGLLRTSNVAMHPNNKGFDFDVQSKRKRKWDLFGITTARAQGTAVADSGTGNVTVRGAVKFGRLFHIFLLLYLTYFLAILPPMFAPEVGRYGVSVLLPILMPLVILGGMMSFYWWRIYQDRNDLADHIENAVHEAKAKRAATRLSAYDDAFSAVTDGSDHSKKRQQK